MRYIATREGVERLAGNGAVTKGQRELIQKLLTDFPDAVELFEYEDYCKTPTLGTASAFISMALDANLHEIDPESGYMQYIATRPRVQKRGTHGLFSSATAVDLASAISELEAHEGNVWTIIYSLRREDAARLEYDNADAWRTLLMENAPTLAKSMKISLENFHWYAAFHDEGHHPHIHMMVWSDDPKEGFLTKDGIAAMRSKLTNAIRRTGSCIAMWPAAAHPFSRYCRCWNKCRSSIPFCSVSITMKLVIRPAAGCGSNWKRTILWSA